MARPRGIPSKFDQAILEKAADGLTTREIAAWLLADHGVKCSHVAVARVLKRTKVERAEITKAVVKEKLGRSVAADLARKNQIRQQVANKASRVWRAIEASMDGSDEPPNPQLVNAWRALKDLENQILTQNVTLSGAVEETGKGVALDTVADLAEAARRNVE